ncbi:hypothetical protein ACOME3_009589 [Neoechinorhynchus agilis]
MLFSFTPTATTAQSIGSLFGPKTTSNSLSTTAGSNIFGGTTTASSVGSIFGRPLNKNPQINEQAKSIEEEAKALDERLVKILETDKLFGDERDDVVRKFNCIQLTFGFGHAIESINESVDIEKSSNKHDQFKTCVYNIRKSVEENNIVCMVFDESYKELKLHSQEIVDALKKVFKITDNSIEVRLDSMYATSDSQTCQDFHIRKGDSSDLSGHKDIIAAKVIVDYMEKMFTETSLLGEVNAGKEALQKLKMVKCYEQKSWTDEDVDLYQKQVPEGMPVKIWETAVLGNPDPHRLLPCPIQGFEELKKRINIQTCQMRIQETKLQSLKRDLRDIYVSCDSIQFVLADLLRWRDRYINRLLDICCKMEVCRRQSIPVSIEEQNLRTCIEMLIEKSNTPVIGLRAKINSLQGRIEEILQERESQVERRRCPSDRLNTVDLRELANILIQLQRAIELIAKRL